MNMITKLNEYFPTHFNKIKEPKLMIPYFEQGGLDPNKRFMWH